MANTQYLKPNRLMSELEEQKIKRQKRKIKYAFGFALLALILGELYVDVYVGAIVAVVLFFFITRDTKTIADAQLESGAQGENNAIELLCGLNDNYVIFNQVKIPAKYSVNGNRECDVLVVGKEALYLIEVKNQRGLITVKADLPQWQVVKKIKHNKSATLSIANPIKQVENQRKGLQQWLIDKGVKVEIIPMVFFVHKEVILHGAGQLSIDLVTRESVLSKFKRGTEKVDQKAIISLITQIQ